MLILLQELQCPSVLPHLTQTLVPISERASVFHKLNNIDTGMRIFFIQETYKLGSSTKVAITSHVRYVETRACALRG